MIAKLHHAQLDHMLFEKMYETAGLDSDSIVNKVKETLNSNIILAKNKSKISN